MPWSVALAHLIASAPNTTGRAAMREPGATFVGRRVVYLDDFMRRVGAPGTIVDHHHGAVDVWVRWDDAESPRRYSRPSTGYSVIAWLEDVERPRPLRESGRRGVPHRYPRPQRESRPVRPLTVPPISATMSE